LEENVNVNVNVNVNGKKKKKKRWKRWCETRIMRKMFYCGMFEEYK